MTGASLYPPCSAFRYLLVGGGALPLASTQPQVVQRGVLPIVERPTDLDEVVAQYLADRLVDLPCFC